MTGTNAEELPFTLRRHSAGYILVEWNKAHTVTERDASALMEYLDGVSPSLCPPMLVHLNNMISLSRPALHAFASELNVSALAIVGPTAVDRAISHFFTSVHEPPYPTQYFDCTDTAERWLVDSHRSS